MYAYIKVYIVVTRLKDKIMRYKKILFFFTLILLCVCKSQSSTYINTITSWLCGKDIYDNSAPKITLKSRLEKAREEAAKLHEKPNQTYGKRKYVRPLNYWEATEYGSRNYWIEKYHEDAQHGRLDGIFEPGDHRPPTIVYCEKLGIPFATRTSPCFPFFNGQPLPYEQIEKKAREALALHIGAYPQGYNINCRQSNLEWKLQAQNPPKTLTDHEKRILRDEERTLKNRREKIRAIKKGIPYKKRKMRS